MYRSPFPPSVSGSYDRWSWGTKYVYTSGTKIAQSFNKFSTKTPNYEALKRSRSLPIREFSYREDITKYQPGLFGNSPSDVNTRYEGYCYGAIGVVVFGTEKVSTLGPSADASARSKVLSKLKDQHINLAQAFAERKQTADLIGKSVNRLASAALAIRHGKLRHASTMLGLRGRFADKIRDVRPSARNLDNYWLEFQYGWKPLLSDIHGAATLMARSYEVNRPLYVTGVSSLREQFPEYAFAQVNGVSYEYVTSKHEVSYKYGIGFSEDATFAARMASTGITDPATLAWELLPYSFVVDWFLPVGQYISNYSATRGLSFINGFRNVKTRAVHTSRWVWTGTPSTRVFYGLGREHVIFTFSRTPIGGFPSPTLVFNPDPLGPFKVASGLALLTQLFKRSL